VTQRIVNATLAAVPSATVLVFSVGGSGRQLAVDLDVVWAGEERLMIRNLPEGFKARASAAAKVIVGWAPTLFAGAVTVSLDLATGLWSASTGTAGTPWP
jgi:hypothetical protein